MDRDPKPSSDESTGDAWLDIPDPLVGVAKARASSAPAPSIPALTRREVKLRRVGALVMSAAWAAVLISFFGVRTGLADIAGFVTGQAAVWAGLLFSILALSMGRGRRGLGASLPWARALAIGAPLAFLMLGLVWLPERAAGEFGAIGPSRSLAACFGLGLLFVVPATALALASVRRSFPSAAGWRGALLGAACGLGAALVLTLHCGSSFGGHIALAHGLPIVLAAWMGALAGAKIARA